MAEWFQDNGLLLGLALLDGLSSAGLIFLVAVGLNLVFGVLRIDNVAHGSLYAIGAYVAASIGLWIAGASLNPWLSFPALIFSAAIVAVTSGVAITFFQNFLPDQVGTATNLYSNAMRVGGTAGYLLFAAVAEPFGYAYGVHRLHGGKSTGAEQILRDIVQAAIERAG